ncbi:SDR family NAD(P)-dependent oxidoreductase [Streptacidiphilus fuscans]|uniref:SDR family NAD(P)-dependent oxidoreductase n=1 Tax=Streptacidiphilus fuscans TaxID=2789292 RepID=A0A931B221_9ACTN|nr:SDR family NAD(P)-dependent oxidoreductase [Streptacidiphilus fuscans]MBF9068831.1 SDR family NAD(P)-dependent oxidoreductase [Streptacidiphilus fuscans]
MSESTTATGSAPAERIVLITGTSSGIGLAVAVAAAQAGWRVVATMRDTAKSEPLRTAAEAAGVGERVEVRRLDVTDRASVDACLAEVIAAHGRLDALVNNAGAGIVGTVEQTGVEPFRSAMEVNFFGVVEATGAAMPLLRAVGGRVVTVTSVGGVVGQPFNEAYCAAKFAAEGFLESLAPVAATVGVHVSVIEPGAVASEFVASQNLDVPALLAAAGPYAPALGAYVERTLAAFGNAQSSVDAAQAVVAVLEDPAPPFRVQTSAAAREFVATKLADADGSAVQGMTGGWVGLARG